MTQNQILAIVIFIYATLPILCALASLRAAHWYERGARARLAERAADVVAREQLATEREIELGRQAHDVRTSINLYSSRIEDDETVVRLLDWANPEVPD